MGSGSKFKLSVRKALGIGIYLDTFPHTISINITFLCFILYIGLGKGYNEK